MCDKSTNKYFKDIFNCENRINEINIGTFNLNVKTDYPENSNVLYWAANTANYNSSFSGSGLPFPNPDIAFDKTPNQGISIVKNGHFNIKMEFPNSFYIHLGKKLIGPTLFYRSCSNENIKQLNLDNNIPYRLLNYPMLDKKKRNSPLFYYNNVNCKIQTQEQILRNSMYPKKNILPNNFWGSIIPN